VVAAAARELPPDLSGLPDHHAADAPRPQLEDVRFATEDNPTPMELVDVLMQLAHIGPETILYDLGSGDGRILRAAAERGAKHAVGIDADEKNVASCNTVAKKFPGKISCIHGDLFEQPTVSEATVVTAVLDPSVLHHLGPVLYARLQPGAMILVVDFAFTGYQWELFFEAEGFKDKYNGDRGVVYRYIVPENKEELVEQEAEGFRDWGPYFTHDVPFDLTKERFGVTFPRPYTMQIVRLTVIGSFVVPLHLMLDGPGPVLKSLWFRGAVLDSVPSFHVVALDERTGRKLLETDSNLEEERTEVFDLNPQLTVPADVVVAYYRLDEDGY